MTRWRVFLLLLLALLLPVRGAMAAGWACPMGEGQGPARAFVSSVPAADELPPCHAAMQPGAETIGHHGASDVSNPGQGVDAPSTPSAGDCLLCAAACSLVSLPSTAVAMQPVLLVASVPPEARATRVPHAAPERLERPPRTP